MQKKKKRRIPFKKIVMKITFILKSKNIRDH